MKQTKIILDDILNSFCLSSQNLNRVYKLSGIKAQLYNGKRSNDKLRAILLRAISEDKAQEIVNKMPFPFIEEYKGTEELKEFINNTHIKSHHSGCKWEDILVPIEKKRGHRIECITQNYAMYYR